eukprot:2332099-Pyramimonas_sp.AAC.2
MLRMGNVAHGKGYVVVDVKGYAVVDVKAYVAHGKGYVVVDVKGYAVVDVKGNVAHGLRCRRRADVKGHLMAGAGYIQTLSGRAIFGHFQGGLYLDTFRKGTGTDTSGAAPAGRAGGRPQFGVRVSDCLLYTSDAADDTPC